MRNELKRFFIDNKYDEVEVNIDEMKVFFRDSILCCIIDDYSEEAMTSHQFKSIMEQLYSGITASGCVIEKSLILLCTTSIKRAADLFINYNSCKDIKEAKVVIDIEEKVILQDEDAYEEAIDICRQITEYVSEIENENRVNESKEDTKATIVNLLKKSCVHIAIINIIIFFIMQFFDVKELEQFMYRYSLNWKRVIDDGQWYRIFTSMFLHWDITHLLNNMLSLCVLGTYLEKTIGRKWIIISYFVTGIIAGFTSMGYNMKLGQEVYAAGASGAIFGLAGVLLAVLVMAKSIGEKISGKRLLIYVILVVWSQISDTQIDNAAHIGGILAGVIVGIVFTALNSIKNKKKL